MTDRNRIECLFLSQEDLLEAGCLDMRLAISAAENAMLAFRRDEILFPDKVVQIFNDDTQERINCLPATLLPEKVCGVKWVSVFPRNPEKYGMQNLSAVIVLSEIERGFPIAFMDGTLCSNVRVGAMGALAARHLARPDSGSIAFIGAGEQAKMHLIGMKTVVPGIEECRVSAKLAAEEQQFIEEMQPLFGDMRFAAAGYEGAAGHGRGGYPRYRHQRPGPPSQGGVDEAGQLLQPYRRLGGRVRGGEAVRQDRLRRLGNREAPDADPQPHVQGRRARDEDVHANLVEVIAGEKSGRETPEERAYFNAVGLAYVDVAIAHAMYLRAREAGAGRVSSIQETMIFQHEKLADWIRM